MFLDSRYLELAIGVTTLFYCICCVLLLYLPKCCYSILKFPKCDDFNVNGQTTALCGLCFTKRFQSECGPLCTSKCEEEIQKANSVASFPSTMIGMIDRTKVSWSL
uniref:Uncharacterized protein n=1 Tax=Romanomermis culicivorax TaxID=13658 RepID=A0A915KG06_ROMCU